MFLNKVRGRRWIHCSGSSISAFSCAFNVIANINKIRVG